MPGVISKVLLVGFVSRPLVLVLLVLQFHFVLDDLLQKPPRPAVPTRRCDLQQLSALVGVFLDSIT